MPSRSPPSHVSMRQWAFQSTLPLQTAMGPHRTMEETAGIQGTPAIFLFFFSYILTTSYRAKNTPTWVCFLFSVAVHTSLTPSYPATPNPTSPLLWTPKTRLCGHIFGVCRLFSAQKLETCPFWHVS